MTRPGALGRQARDAAEQGIAALRPRGWRWLLILAIACTLLAVVAARLSGPSGPWLWNWDLPKVDFPLAALFHAALRDGHLPLWSDDLGLGFPLYAEGQIGAFYPPNWLLYQLPPLVALDVSRVLHLAMAGVGAGILTGRLSGSRTGSLAAAAVVVLGGAITAKLQWTNLVVAYAWLPWVLVPLVRRPAPTALGLAAAGLAWGLQALAGHPNTWLLTGLAAVVLLAAISPRPRTLGRIVAFGSLGGAVGAVQLVPTLLLTSLSVRSGGLPVDDLFTSSATPFDPLLLGFAGAFARWSSGGLDVANAWYPDGGFALLEAGVYVGLPAVALAAVGLTARRARPFALLAAVMVAIPIVAALRPAAWSEIPILDGLRSPTRSYLVVQLAVAVIAGIGVGRLGRSTGAWRRAALAVGGLGVFYVGALALAALGGGLFEGVLRWSATGLSVEGAGQARLAALDTLGAPTPQLLLELAVGAAAVGLVALRSSPGLRRAAAALAIVVPLALLSPAVNRVEPAAMSSFADTPLVAAIRAAGPRRVLMVDEPVWHDAMPDQLAAVGVAGIDMFSSLDLAASDALRRDMEHGPDAAGLQQLAGVDLVVRFGAAACPDGGGEAVAVGFPPAPWLTGVARLCPAVVPAVPPAWIPEHAVIAVTGGGSPLRPADAQLDVAAANAEATPATVIARDPGRGTFSVDAPGSGWVWIDRAWWPGWIVEVDGAGVTPLRAAAGQLVPVGGGRHVVEQRLVPWDALLGLAAGLLALAVASAWLMVRGRRRAARDRGPGQPRRLQGVAGDRGRARRMPPADSVHGGGPPAMRDAVDSDRPRLPWIVLPLGAGVIAFVAYVLRLLPGVGFWDTAVFQAAPPVLGLTHPTGYPLWNLLGWAFQAVVPLGDPALRLNLMTAVAGAGAVLLAAAVAIRCGARPVVAAAGALAFGLATPFWRTAARADPHPLHVLLALAVVLLLLEWDRRGRPLRWLVAAALLSGLALGNHLLMALMGPAIVVYVLSGDRGLLRRPGHLAAVGGAALLGMAVYLYVPLRAAASPAVHHDYAPTTWDLFWRYVLGRDFGGSMGFLGVDGVGLALGHLGDFVESSIGAVGWPVFGGLVLLALAGTIQLATRAPRALALLGLGAGLTLYAALGYANSDLERYYFVPLAVLAILAAIGATRLLEEVPWPVARYLLAIGSLVAALSLAPRNYDAGGSMSAVCYVEAVTRVVPQTGVVMSSWSYATPLWYETSVKRARPDLTVVLGIDTIPDQVGTWFESGRPVFLIQPDAVVGAIAQDWRLEPTDACGVTMQRVIARIP